MKTDTPADYGYTLHRMTADAVTENVIETYFLGIALCTRGTARITTGVDTYYMSPNSIVVIIPSSMMQISDVSPDWEVKFICITRMELLRDAAAQILPFVKDTWAMQQFFFEERESIVSSFHATYNFLEMLLTDEQTTSKYEQGVCVFRCLMLGMRDKSIHLQRKEKTAANISLNSYNQFVLLLNKHCKTMHAVNFYADQLHISAQYLGRICRMYDGRGPKEIIDDMLIYQLKTTFKNTTKTMKEICYEYNFANLSFMSSYFHRHTGLTPTEFRNKYREGTL